MDSIINAANGVKLARGKSLSDRFKGNQVKGCKMDLEGIAVQVFGYVMPFFAGYIAAIIKTKGDLKPIKIAMQAMLRDRLIQAYNHYVEEKHWCPHYAKDSINNMYKCYEQLGANGVMTRNFEAIMALGVVGLYCLVQEAEVIV